MKRSQYNPDRDIPDQNGRVILVTGGNSGLGRESVIALAKHNPAKIYMAARSPDKAAKAMDLVRKAVPNANVEVLEMDLSSIASVNAAVKQVLAETSRLDILMCNAGVVACPKALSKDGYEIQFATNHLGHAALIRHLLPVLNETAKIHGDARIVALTSPGYGFAPKGGIEFHTLRTEQDFGFGGPGKRYGQSKLANILYTKELATRHPNLTCVSIDPGAAKTELYYGSPLFLQMIICITTWMRGELMWGAAEGAHNQLWAATAPKDQIKENGGLYKSIGNWVMPKGHLTDADLGVRLWEWTEEELS